MSYKGISICGLTIGRYYELFNDGSIIEKNGNCPEEKKYCGIIDSVDNILCININEDCPISYIKFSKNPPIAEINDLKVINGYSNKYLLFK